MPVTKFLRKAGTDDVWPYTPALEARGDMEPISLKEAHVLLGIKKTPKPEEETK